MCLDMPDSEGMETNSKKTPPAHKVVTIDGTPGRFTESVVYLTDLDKYGVCDWPTTVRRPRRIGLIHESIEPGEPSIFFVKHESGQDRWVEWEFPTFAAARDYVLNPWS